MTVTEILLIITQELLDHHIHPEVNLNSKNIGNVTIGELELDSLDLLEFSMNIENDLKVELNLAEFPADATLLDLSEHIHKLAQKTSVDEAWGN
jgi:acyl carrier protein